MKRIILILLLLIGLFGMTGCDAKTSEETTQKKVIYKMRIEDLPYSRDHLYYDYKDAMGNKIFFNIYNNNNSCMYYATIKGDELTRQDNYQECDYSINGNNIEVTLRVNRMIWKNDKDNFLSNTYENISLTGELNDNLTQLSLLIDGKNYLLYNSSYSRMLENNMEYGLYNEEDNSFYDINGLSVIEKFNEDTYENEKVQLDLSEYRIIEVNNYDEALNYDFAMDPLLTPEQKAIKTINKVKDTYWKYGYDFQTVLQSSGFVSEEEYYESLVKEYSSYRYDSSLTPEQKAQKYVEEQKELYKDKWEEYLKEDGFKNEKEYLEYALGIINGEYNDYRDNKSFSPERKAKMFFNQTKREYLEQGGALEDLYRNLNVSSEQEFIDKYKSMYY